MGKFIKPMQPCNANIDKIEFPCIAQKKIDGMKMIIRSDNNGGIELLGRSMKPITNQWLHEVFREVFAEFLQLKHFVFEGELQAGGHFENCDGLLSAKHRAFDDVVFWIFDEITDTDIPYRDRYAHVCTTVEMLNNSMVRAVPSFVVKDMETLMYLHDRFESDPMLDGTIVRWAESTYKAGKRTENEQFVVKIKNQEDMEVEIIGFKELQHNTNEGYTNPLGRTERSTSKEGLIGGDTLGAFICKTSDGQEVSVGSFRGMTREEGQRLWKIRDELIGKLIKIKYMRMTQYGVPLHPVYLGFRDPLDLG